LGSFLHLGDQKCQKSDHFVKNKFAILTKKCQKCSKTCFLVPKKGVKPIGISDTSMIFNFRGLKFTFSLCFLSKMWFMKSRLLFFWHFWSFFGYPFGGCQFLVDFGSIFGVFWVPPLLNPFLVKNRHETHWYSRWLEKSHFLCTFGYPPLFWSFLDPILTIFRIPPGLSDYNWVKGVS